MIARPPIMCFDLGGLKISERFSTIPSSNQSTSEPWEAQGAVLRDLHFCFSEGPIVGGGGGGVLYIKECPSLPLI